MPLAAGSGLIRTGNLLWIAADDLHHLIQVPMDGSYCGQGYRIFPGDLPEKKKERKKIKPDTEALIEISSEGEKKLVAFPSGSKSNRTRGALVSLDHNNQLLTSAGVDFSPLIQILDPEIPDLNIEGGAVWNEKLVLLQRGNGKAGFNAVIELELSGFLAGIDGHWNLNRILQSIRQVDLPDFNGVPLTFTDCETVNESLYFSAAAEGGNDTYLDGQVMGSAIGCLDKNLNPKILGTIEHQKIEGLAFFSAREDKLEFLLVTDADDPEIPSQLICATTSTHSL